MYQFSHKCYPSSVVDRHGFPRNLFSNEVIKEKPRQRLVEYIRERPHPVVQDRYKMPAEQLENQNPVRNQVSFRNQDPVRQELSKKEVPPCKKSKFAI